MSAMLSGVIAAEWRDLVMVSYEVDPVLLVPHVPRGTSLDFHQNRALLSIVALRMRNTRVAGLPLPFLQDLEGVNFRFYVWRREGAELRRGVVFLKEFVSSAVVTLGARVFFNESYETVPMRHTVSKHGAQGAAAYEWQTGGRWNRVAAGFHGTAAHPAADSLEMFIKERGWGYSRQADGSTLEYRVEHPSWAIRAATDLVVRCDASAAIGPQFARALSGPPASAFIAVGSEATVHTGGAVD